MLLSRSSGSHMLLILQSGHIDKNYCGPSEDSLTSLLINLFTLRWKHLCSCHIELITLSPALLVLNIIIFFRNGTESSEQAFVRLHEEGVRVFVLFIDSFVLSGMGQRAASRLLSGYMKRVFGYLSCPPPPIQTGRTKPKKIFF